MQNIIRLSFVFLSLWASTIYAVQPAFYMGLMVGESRNGASTADAQIDNSTLTTPAYPKQNQFGGRIYMGYDINQYAGVEGGLTYFSSINYNTRGVDTCSDTKVSVRDFDLVAKGMIPINAFSIFGKAGVAATYQTVSGALNPNSSTNPDDLCGESSNDVKFRPTVSLGASYDLSQNWVADISWNRIMVGGMVNNVNLYAIGISYHFVDRYCGQFLCD